MSATIQPPPDYTLHDMRGEGTYTYAHFLTLEGATAGEFTSAAYLAARVEREVLTKEWFAKDPAKFPGNADLSRMEGWALLNLADPQGAEASFVSSHGLLKPEEKAGAELLAGIAIGNRSQNLRIKLPCK